MTERIVIIGAGGFGREALDVVEATNSVSHVPAWQVVGVVDDAPRAADRAMIADRGYSYLGTMLDARSELEQHRYVIAVGSPALRSRIADDIRHVGSASTPLVHPRAVIGSRTRVANGVVICGGVQISTNVSLGEHVHVNPGAIIGHDAKLLDFVSVNPGAIVSGAVVVEAKATIGAGAVVLQGRRVGASATVGASACVTRDVADGKTVKGVPAR